MIGNKIFVFGGWNGKKALNDMFVLQLDSFQWKEIEVTGQKPGLRNNHATAVSSKYIYLHGGHNGDIWLDDLYIYDSSNSIWSKVGVFGQLPSARACHTLSKVDKKLYMFGGYDGIKCYNDIEIFEIETKTWVKNEVKGPVPLARNAHSITVVNKHLILFGGHSGNKHLKDLFVFDTENLSWYEPKIGGEAPEGLRGHTATHLGNKIFFFGGYDGKGRSNELFILNIEDFNFKHISDKDNFPGARQRHSAIAIDNKRIMIFGGFDGQKWLNDLHILNASIIIEKNIRKQCDKDFSIQMKGLINNKDFSDFILVVEEKFAYCHKCILSVRSEYFKKKFESQEDMKQMDVPNLSYSSILKILDFIYTGSVENLDVSDCFEILTVASEFKLNELKMICENTLIYSIDTKNVVDILILSHKNCFLELKSMSMNFLLQHFSEVSSKKSFENLENYPQLLMEVMKLSLTKLEL